jgi:hypothetical protein
MLVVIPQILPDRIDHESMILLLGEAGNCYGTDHAAPFDDDGETSAVGGVAIFGDQVGLLEALPLAYQELSDIERTVAKAVNKPDFSPDPLIVVGGCPRPAGMKNLMFTAGDIDCDRESVPDCKLDEGIPDLPRCIFIERVKLKFLFFLQ